MNLFDLSELPQFEELITVLSDDRNVRIERIVSTGQSSGWYDQQETEFVALLQGFARIEYENSEIVNLSSGDTIIIPPHKKHRVCFTSCELPCIWLCVFWK